MHSESKRSNQLGSYRISKTYLVASTKAYRKYARILPKEADIVLEVGASYGDATEILKRQASQVFAIEHSKDLFDTLKVKFDQQPGVNLLWHDARDIHGALRLCPRADVLFFDIGGDAPAHVAIYILQLYMLAYQPRIAVIRNIALAGFIGHVEHTEFPDKKGYRRYISLPSEDEILDHYQKEDSRSAQKFIERTLKHRADYAHS